MIAFWRWVGGAKRFLAFLFLCFLVDGTGSGHGGTGGGGVGPPFFGKLLTFLQVFVGVVEEFDEVRCFCGSESSYSGVHCI